MNDFETSCRSMYNMLASPRNLQGISHEHCYFCKYKQNPDKSNGYGSNSLSLILGNVLVVSNDDVGIIFRKKIKYCPECGRRLND